MLRNLTTVATIGMLMASSALAQCSDSAKTAKAEGKCCATKAQVASAKAKECKSTCSSEKVASDMPAEFMLMAKIAKHGGPAISYKVGDESTCCPMTAEKLAKSNKASMQYVVGETTYVSEGEAKEAYAVALERYLEDLTTVQFAVGDDCVRCPMTAKSMAAKANKAVHYRLGSFDFEDMQKAKALAASARKAAEDVKLAAYVGEKKYHCTTTAGNVAKAEGKMVEYAVGGMKTKCSKTAQLDLTLAKVDAALSTIAKG